MKSARENWEAARDFVNNSRKILYKQIAINDKIEETGRLKEFIINEEEQLAEKHKTFDEDKESFNDYINTWKADAEKASAEVKALIEHKTKL